MSNVFESNGVQYKWIDADTFVNVNDPNDSYRVQGYNAPEESKIQYDEDGQLRFKRGQLFGEETTKAVEGISASGGYNIIEDLGHTDSYGRKRVRLKNHEGRDLTNTLYEAGAVNANQFTDAEGIKAQQHGRLSEELRGKRAYEDIITDNMFGNVDERKFNFKARALDETEYANSMAQVIAQQNGLDLNDPDDQREIFNRLYDANYDSRSAPFSAFEFRKADRTKEGVAYDQLGTAWDQGWNGMTTGLAGFAELMGVQLGSETLEAWGANRVQRAKDDMLEDPVLRNMDYRDVDSVWDGWQYLTNNMAMSAPYLVLLTGGAAATAATGGTALAPVAATLTYGSLAGTYAGQVWNDIEGPRGRLEASGAMAAGTAMALLDRLGMQGIIKPSQVLTTQGRAVLARELAKRNGISVVAAKDLVRDMSNDVIKEAVKGLGNFASGYVNKGTLGRAGARIIQGAGGEGLTEAAQEGLGYLASTGMSEGGWEQHFSTPELKELLAGSFIAGGSLGAGFASAGQAYGAGKNYAFQKSLERGDTQTLNEYQQIAQDVMTEGPLGNVNDIIAENKQNSEPTFRDKSKTQYLSEQGKIQRGGIWDKVKNLPKYAPEMWRAASTTAFRPEILRRSETARKLYALVGQPLGKIYAGRDVQSMEQKYRSDLINIINPKRVFARFGMSDRISNSNKISDMIRDYANGNMTPEVRKYEQQILETIAELDAFAAEDYAMKKGTYDREHANDKEKLEQSPKQLSQWWLKHQSWDWKKVRQYRDDWYNFMRKNTDYTQQELDALYNKISNQENATDFSLVEGAEWKPGSSKGRSDSISDKEGFEKFANTDILQNMINAANETSKYAAYTEYFGAGGRDLDYMLQKMQQEGLSEEEVSEIAYHVKNIIDAGTGNYNPIVNRKLNSIQQSVAFYSAIIGLPMSAISSFPEFGMVLYNNNNIRKAIETSIGEMTKGMGEILKQNTILRNVPHAHTDRQATQRLIEAGLFPDDATIATRLGLGETDVSKAWWQKQFFKIFGITGITQVQRAIAASTVSGFVGDRIKILAAKPDDADMNQEQLELFAQLTDLGIDVDGMVEMYKKYNDPQVFDTFFENNPTSDADYHFIDDQMQTATWYFTNERVQNPQAFNRPLFFQDPRFQLLVQFNGFISTFTANVVPKLWRNYVNTVKSPQMAYNTFALMATMMVLAGASQWLKDYIKFGGSTPYLNNAQLLQRSLQASGLLGTGERVLGAALPLYGGHRGPFDFLYGETVGSSPAVRNVSTLGTAATQLAKGNTESAFRHASKLTPALGVFTPYRNAITELLHGRMPTEETLYPNRDRR